MEPVYATRIGIGEINLIETVKSSIASACADGYGYTWYAVRTSCLSLLMVIIIMACAIPYGRECVVWKYISKWQSSARMGYVMANARRTSIYLANWFVGFAAIYKTFYIDNAIGVMAFWLYTEVRACAEGFGGFVPPFKRSRMEIVCTHVSSQQPAHVKSPAQIKLFHSWKLTWWRRSTQNTKKKEISRNEKKATITDNKVLQKIQDLPVAFCRLPGLFQVVATRGMNYHEKCVSQYRKAKRTKSKFGVSLRDTCTHCCHFQWSCLRIFPNRTESTKEGKARPPPALVKWRTNLTGVILLALAWLCRMGRKYQREIYLSSSFAIWFAREKRHPR